MFTKLHIISFFVKAISKFESLINQVQKNAKDIQGRLAAIEKCILFQRPPAKSGNLLPEAKVRFSWLCQHLDI